MLLWHQTGSTFAAQRSTAHFTNSLVSVNHVCVLPVVNPASWHCYRFMLSFALQQVVCQGQATIVFLSEDYKPIRVPPHIKQAFTKLHQDYKAGLSTAAANP